MNSETELKQSWAQKAKCPKCNKRWANHRSLLEMCELNERLIKLLTRYITFFNDGKKSGYYFVEPDEVVPKKLKRAKDPKLYDTPFKAIEDIILNGTKAFDGDIIERK